MSDRVRMECPSCGYKCVPQWLNDKAHCLKCQAVLRKRGTGAGAGAGTAVNETRRQVGEASTYKQSPGSAMESTSAGCSKSPDGNHHWKFGKCSYCQKSEAAGGGKATGASRPPTREPASALSNAGAAMTTPRTGSASVPPTTKQKSRDFTATGASVIAKPSAPAPQATQPQRNDRTKVECPSCGYKCVPQWLNDEAHCLKCQAILKKQPTVHGGGEVHHGVETKRQPGEVSTHKYSAGSAMESVSGTCSKAPDGMHHWKFGKCTYCQKTEGQIVNGSGVMSNPGGAGGGGCAAGGKCMFKFAKCTKCGKKSY